jgi:predicted Rossmann-fold nucleotide-binding protein
MSEFVEGFEMLKSIRWLQPFLEQIGTHLKSRFYEDATDLAGRLAKLGFAVITGGSKGGNGECK